MPTRLYYTLLASLPPLSRFDRAGRLPISRERLNQRLRMLAPDDARLLDQMTAFLVWRKDASSLTDKDMISRFKDLEKWLTKSDLNTLLTFPVDQRTIMAALRRRHRGGSPPTGGEPWGAGRFVRHIERNWEAPHFKLAAVYPWITRARLHLEAGEILALDRLLKNTLWDHMDRTVPAYEFGIRAVMSYRIKWDILDQWLSHDVKKARIRFEGLLKEITDGQTKLFH